MKVIVQILAYNEEDKIRNVLKKIQKKIDGVNEIKILLINDSSKNKIREMEEEGVDNIISNSKRLGLAKTFMKGINKCLEEGADIIVYIDRDGQYDPEEIPLLIKPIIQGRAHLTIRNRSPFKLRHFSYVKRFFQYLGTKFLKFLRNSEIKDATSGFRAFSKELAAKIQVFSNYTYTLETIIQNSQLDYEIL